MIKEMFSDLHRNKILVLTKSYSSSIFLKRIKDSSSIFIFNYVYVCESMWEYVSMDVGACEIPKKVSDALKLEEQAVVSNPMVLGTELGSFVRAVYDANFKVFSSVPPLLFLRAQHSFVFKVKSVVKIDLWLRALEVLKLHLDPTRFLTVDPQWWTPRAGEPVNCGHEGD